MDDKLKQIMSSVFEKKVSDITENSSPENIETWDSLKHMNLVLALEEEFGVEFNDDEIVQLINYKDIKSIVSKKQNI